MLHALCIEQLRKNIMLVPAHCMPLNEARKVLKYGFRYCVMECQAEAEPSPIRDEVIPPAGVFAV